MNKQLLKVVNRLPISAAILLFYGVFVYGMLYFGSSTVDWYVYYIPFKIMGFFIGFITLAYLFKNAGFLFAYTIYRPDLGLKMNNILANYKSKKLIFIIPSLLLLFDIFRGLPLYQNTTAYPNVFDGYLGEAIFFSIVTFLIGGSIECISAWWNVKKRLKKGLIINFEFDNKDKELAVLKKINIVNTLILRKRVFINKAFPKLSKEKNLIKIYTNDLYYNGIIHLVGGFILLSVFIIQQRTYLLNFLPLFLGFSYSLVMIINHFNSDYYTLEPKKQSYTTLSNYIMGYRDGIISSIFYTSFSLFYLIVIYDNPSQIDFLITIYLGAYLMSSFYIAIRYLYAWKRIVMIRHIAS